MRAAVAPVRNDGGLGEFATECRDYPAERLDVKLVLEEDDHATRAAVSRLRLGAPFQVIVAPDVGPRTKPKALNIALAFARGEFTAVYDAEDRPEPAQLRRAVGAFDADPALACVQARLTIDNTGDGWLARGIMAQTPQAFWTAQSYIPARSEVRAMTRREEAG